MTTETSTIELTPTWQAVLPILLVTLESGAEEDKKIARKELRRMAEAADRFNELSKAAKPTPETPAGKPTGAQ